MVCALPSHRDGRIWRGADCSTRRGSLLCSRQRTPGRCGTFGSLPLSKRKTPHIAPPKVLKLTGDLSMMSGCPEPLDLRIRKSTPTAQFLRVATDLSSATVTQLHEFARRVQLSVPQLATAAVAIFVHRLTQAEERGAWSTPDGAHDGNIQPDSGDDDKRRSDAPGD